MTMYELSDSTAEQILIADHQKGVQVRVLLDHDYSGGSVNQAAYSTLSAAGVPVAVGERLSRSSTKRRLRSMVPSRPS